MPNILIQQIVQGPAAGKPFTGPTGTLVEVTEWIVNGLVDGQPIQNCMLRALSKKVLWAVQAGNTVVCDPAKTYQGQLQFKITTPSDANGKVNAMPTAPQHQAPPVYQLPPPYQPPQNRAPAPPVQNTPPAWAQNTSPATPPTFTPPPQTHTQRSGYNQEELEDLMIQAYKFSSLTLPKDCDQRAVAAFAATYIIQATKEGIKIKGSGVKTTHTPESQVNPMDAIWDLIYGKGLGERVSNCNIPEPLLVEWFNQSGKDANAFAIRINYEIKKIEEGKVE